MPTSGARVNIEEMRPARSVLTDTYWLQDGGYWHFSLLASNFDLFFIVMALLSVAKKNKNRNTRFNMDTTTTDDSTVQKNGTGKEL